MSSTSQANVSIAPAATVVVDGFAVCYTDAPSLQTAARNIFEQRIYHFHADSAAPRVIDGGAHIGLATLYFKKVCPQARVLCFEPDPASAGLLRRNLVANRLADVEVIEAGLSGQTGTARFRSDGSDGGRLSEAREAAESIRTVCLSDYLIEPADFLKLNIEGQELAVLNEVEAQGRLRQIRELVLEYHGWPDAPQRLGAILELLDRNGFCYLVHDFDHQTNPSSKPPFRLRPGTPWFCLVYARWCGACANEHA